MIRKVLGTIILLPLAALIILLAIANRQAVTISLDPFLADTPALAANQPLFLVILGAVIVGVIVGGTAAWIKQGKWRRAARLAHGEARTLRAENAALKERLAAEPPPERLAYRRPPAA